jgi:hypothetical protein
MKKQIGMPRERELREIVREVVDDKEACMYYSSNNKRVGVKHGEDHAIITRTIAHPPQSELFFKNENNYNVGGKVRGTSWPIIYPYLLAISPPSCLKK